MTNNKKVSGVLNTGIFCISAFGFLFYTQAGNVGEKKCILIF